MAHLSVALGPRTSATRSMGLTPVFVAWGLALSLAAVAVSAWFIPALIVIWMIVLLARHPADAIIWNAIMLAAWGAASFGFYERATFLPQVLSYGQTAQSPWELLSRFDIWGPRYLVAYPPAWFAVQFELDLDEVWTYFLASVLAVEAAVVHRIWLGTQAPRVPSTAARIGIGIVSGIGFIVLGHFMHGRLAPAHLGMAMILLGLIRWGQRGYPSTSDLFLVGFGLFPLSLMSSGTVIPATMELLCSAWLFAAVDWRARWRTLLWVPLLLLPAVPFMLVGYFKNVKFFEDSEGGFWTVLDHGAGRVFSEGAFVGLSVAFLGGCALAVLLYFVLSKSVRRRLPGLSPLTLALPASGLVGLFGYSTMTMAVPALAALGLLALSGGVRGQPIDGAPRE